jgi:enamine deaminase RidA (YjgF/YER057c/UK114 family)|tara:strand:+ start:196 stop:588 length:393 start_codon:yes stop_codon:yes gene_type:complete
MEGLNPRGWKRPKGYSNGIAAEGRFVFVAGMVGWNADEKFESGDFVDQFRSALENTVAVLKEGGAGPEHICRMTMYFTDKQLYLSRLPEVGQAYRDVIGKNFPTMAAVQVVALMEDDAKVEIETTAVVPS